MNEMKSSGLRKPNRCGCFMVIEILHIFVMWKGNGEFKTVYPIFKMWMVIGWMIIHKLNSWLPLISRTFIPLMTFMFIITLRIGFNLLIMFHVLSVDHSRELIRPISFEDVKHVVFQLKAFKAPSLDDIHAILFHRYWSSMKYDIFNKVSNFFFRAKLIVQSLLVRSFCSSRSARFLRLSRTSDPSGFAMLSTE